MGGKLNFVLNYEFKENSKSSINRGDARMGPGARGLYVPGAFTASLR